MKRLLAIFILLCLSLSLIFVSRVYAQELEESEFRKVYREYTLSVERYKKAHENYVLARSQYLKFNTLQSKTNARNATLAMLEARDEVAISYLDALKAKLEETPGISVDALDALYFRIDEEVAWFSDHKARLSSAATPEDLVDDSDQARDRYKSITPLFYEILSTISSGKLESFRVRFAEVFNAIKDKVNEIREEEREGYSFSSNKLQIIDRWIFETENRVSRAEGKKIEAGQLMDEIGEKRKDNRSIYERVLVKQGESLLYLKEASSFLKEMVREIKTAE